MTNNTTQLQDFLNKVEIPKYKPKPKTFQSIARQPHYENVLSNLYAFYFDCREEHGMQNLFIDSLLQEIKKQKDFDFPVTEFDAATECSTNKGGRVDLLISDENNAIIIENKVYHHLNNDLKDYWKSIEQKNKIGIVLSLHKTQSIPHQQFINITHFDLLKAVMQNLGNHILSASDKYVIYLKDLYQNISNLTSPSMGKQQINFYLDNQQEVIDICEVNDVVHKHLLNQIDLAHKEFEDITRLDDKRSKRLRFFRSHDNPLLMFTIVIDKLMTPDRNLWIGVELQRDLLNDREQYKSLFAKDGNDFQILYDHFYTNTNNSWSHFAGRTYEITKKEDYQDLNQFITAKINQDGFLEIFNRLNKFLTKEKRKIEERNPQTVEQ